MARRIESGLLRHSLNYQSDTWAQAVHIADTKACLMKTHNISIKLLIRPPLAPEETETSSQNLIYVLIAREGVHSPHIKLSLSRFFLSPSLHSKRLFEASTDP